MYVDARYDDLLQEEDCDLDFLIHCVHADEGRRVRCCIRAEQDDNNGDMAYARICDNHPEHPSRLEPSPSDKV